MENKINPLLRWAGGKRWFSKLILDHLPPNFENYFELFLGGASIYLSLYNNGKLNNDIYLSDCNSDLMNFYKTLKYKKREVICDLNRHQNTKEYYYLERTKKYTSDVKEASRFFFLNRTSFNGIYRENLKGEYNVPYGFKNYKVLFDDESINQFSRSLKKSKLFSKDFSYFIDKIKKNDLIFLDPPYTVAHNNNGFVKYNQKIFSWEDQIRLSEFTKEIAYKGAFFIMTNADHSSLRDLYSNHANIQVLERVSLIGGKKARRGTFSELLIKNY